MRKLQTGAVFCWVLLGAGCAPVMAWAADEIDRAALEQAFTGDIAPILERHCADCHNADAPEHELDLSSLAGALKGGVSGPAVAPGRAAESMVHRFVQLDGDPHMPPEGQLNATEIATLAKWIDSLPASLASAEKKIRDEDRAHWSYLPVVRHEPPSVSNPDWVRNAIDAFVLAGLDQAELSPSPEATKLALVRRATFDLIGLPPTPEEVQSFLADESPDAYEKLIDRLLASEHYGERWGRHWLDVARYADSDGFEFDMDRPQAYKYRDYVIRSFNEDKPYDRFIEEQIAGDEIAPGNQDALIATAFLRNGPTIDNQKNEKIRLDELDDVVSTTSAVVMGLTVGCARCHDHKYDAIPQRDYYRMLAVFNSMEREMVDDVMCVQDIGRNPRETHVLLRGEPHMKGDVVEPGVLSVLETLPVQFPESPEHAASTGRRATLAHWLARPENPLTARVMANRIWHYHFGQGLVRTPSDYGVRGERPTHPELLDWLASEFVAGGWRMKPLHRQIMLSSTYRQASVQDVEKSKHDPQNVWLWRFPLKRNEAEVIRDTILSVAGTLNTQMFGPGVHPRIDPSVIATGSTSKWPVVEKEGPEQWRRSVYVFVKRSVLVPMLEGFDAPNATTTCDRRLVTTVPTQSLQLMNNVFGNDQALLMAQRLRREAGAELPAQIDRAYWLAFQRPVTDGQRAAAVEFVQAETEQHVARLKDDASVYEADRANVAAERALADFCHVLLNANEFVYVE
ncbi:MAG: PSD1 and planctomycete cytochrome C domain-containing protein [Planctomycetia bacterium]|nr:PSD1 and planctomycete cytochrome C domain-containing protein [Planctomycetia bacterium]